MRDVPQQAKGLLITLAGVLVLCPDSLLIRLVTADTWTTIFYRGAFTAVAVAVFLGLRHRSGLARMAGEIDLHVVAAGLFYGIGNVCFVQSINRTLVANTLVILASTPLIAALFSRLFLSERIHRATWAAILVVLAGVAAIFAGSFGGGHFAGDLLAIAAAAAMAANLTVLRCSRMETPLPSVVLGASFAALAAFPFAAPALVSHADLLVLAVLGGVVMPVSFGLIFLGPKYLPAPEVALILLLEAILGPLLVWFVLAEEPPTRIVLSGGVIVATVAVHAYLGLRRRG